MRSIFLPTSGITYSESFHLKTYIATVVNRDIGEVFVVIAESEERAAGLAAAEGQVLNIVELFPIYRKIEQIQLGIYYPEGYDTGPPQ